jgi:hypothetical protein
MPGWSQRRLVQSQGAFIFGRQNLDVASKNKSHVSYPDQFRTRMAALKETNL